MANSQVRPPTKMVKNRVTSFVEVAQGGQGLVALFQITADYTAQQQLVCEALRSSLCHYLRRSGPISYGSFFLKKEKKFRNTYALAMSRLTFGRRSSSVSRLISKEVWSSIPCANSVAAYHLRMADLAPFSHQGPRRFCGSQEAAGVQQRLQNNLECLMLVNDCF